MATRPDIPAFPAHEERVRAFMASVPPRRRQAVERRFPVETDQPDLEVSDPAVLDQIEISRGQVLRTPLRTLPSYLEES